MANALRQKTATVLPVLSLVAAPNNAYEAECSVHLSPKVHIGSRSKELIKESSSTGGLVAAVTRSLALGQLADALRV